MESHGQVTEKQRRVYEFIRDKIRNRGYGPTVREIGKRFDIRSPNGVMCHLKALEKKGLIKREANRSRAIQLAAEPVEERGLPLAGRIAAGAVYGDYQAEMDLFNRAFCDAMMEGDAKGRVFTFPIPTINVTRDFDWDSPAFDAFMEITAKYGVPYFANYVNSDLSPEDAVSMCCRLRLDTTELRKRGGGPTREVVVPGCTPAISPSWMRTATSRLWTARRT